MAVSVSRWKYRVTYQNYLGGITLMNPTVFTTIRGFSNKFWGWGGEDDDLYCRLVRYESFFICHPVYVTLLIQTQHQHQQISREQGQVQDVEA